MINSVKLIIIFADLTFLLLVHIIYCADCAYQQVSLNQVGAEIDVPLLDGHTQRSPRAGMYGSGSYILLFCGYSCKFAMILVIQNCNCLRLFRKVCLQQLLHFAVTD